MDSSPRSRDRRQGSVFILARRRVRWPRHVEVGTSGVPRETRGGVAVLDGFVAEVERSQRRQGSILILQRPRDTRWPRRGEVGTTGREIAAAAGSILILERPRGLDSPSRGGRGHQMFHVKYAARSGVLHGLLAALERSQRRQGSIFILARQGCSMAPSRGGRDVRCST